MRYSNRRSNRASLCLLSVLVVIVGCGGGGRESPQVMFAQCRYAEAERILRYMVPDASHKDYALCELMYASAAFEGGDYAGASDAMRDAAKAMEKIGGGEDAAAVMGSESSKVYRGDPYEKAMAHLYSGILALRRQDDERALACFRRATVADQSTRTENEEQTKDFAAGHWFAALAYQRLGEPENARVRLQQAAKYAGWSDVPTVKLLAEANVCLLIESGAGCYKTASGPGGSVCTIEALPDPVSQVTVQCDAVPLGEALMLDDLHVEAVAHGWGEMDSLRLTKGITREIISRAPFISMFSSTIHSEADLRAWTFLPRNLYVWSGRIEPGLHTIALRCRNAKGEPLAEYDQLWFYVPVRKDKLNVMAFRIVPYRQNIEDKVVVPCGELGK